MSASTTRFAWFLALWLTSVGLARAQKTGGTPQERMQRADRASSQGAYTLALELYLDATGGIDQLNREDQGRLLKRTFETCMHLLAQQSVSPAVRGLVALLPLTRRDILTPRFAVRVRETLENTAMGLVLSGKSFEALPALKALMADGPGSPMRWALLVRALLELNEFERARDTLRRGIALFPDSPELHFARAALAGALSKQAVSQAAYARAEALLQNATKDLKKAALRKPGQAGILRALGKVQSSLWTYYQATGQHHKSMTMLLAAEDAYSDAAQLDPADAQAAFELARLLFAAQDWVWSEVWLREAFRRFRMLRDNLDASPAVKQAALRHQEECLHLAASTFYHRALDAANTAHFDLARQLIRTAAHKVPAYASRSSEFQGWLVNRRRQFDSELRRLANVSPYGDSLVATGDLWMRVHRFDRARSAYADAAAQPLQAFTRAQVDGRVFGALSDQVSYHAEKFTVGDLLVELEAPDGMDLDNLRRGLQKAHAITMSAFPHRLNGALSVKVFGNRRAYLEQAGPRVSANQGGHYVFGRVVTFHDPARTLHGWLGMLVHEIAHRYIDEMTYARSPRWLSEGLAQWVGHGWSARDQRRLERVADDDGVLPWDALEEHFIRNWNDPATMATLYLQSHHMVHWLTERYSFERLAVLMAVLRDGQPLEHAVMASFGTRLDDLERQWRETLGD